MGVEEVRRKSVSVVGLESVLSGKFYREAVKL